MILKKEVMELARCFLPRSPLRTTVKEREILIQYRRFAELKENGSGLKEIKVTGI